MNTTRIAVLGVALVAGAAAFFLMMGNRPQEAVQIVQPAKEKTVRVLVADIDFERGQRLGVETLRWVDWPEKALSPLYLTETQVPDLQEIAGAVARTSIVAGEPIIEGKIVRTGSAGLLAAILQPGMRAVTMRVSPETASGGFILPGDRVDIMYTSEGRGGGANRTRTIFENVKVLAINTIYSEQPETAAIEGATATIELSPADAEAFISARSQGTVSLVLRSIFTPEDEVEAKKSSGVTVIRYGRS